MERPLSDVINEDDDESLLLPEPQNGGETSRCSIPCRYIMVALMVLGFFNAFAVRTAFNMSLVAMVNFTQPAVLNVSTPKCTRDAPHNSTTVPQSGEFSWGPGLQSIILGAFYYGYPVAQIPSGYLAERFGGRFLFAFIGLSSGILCLLMPLMARLSPVALIVLRAIQGFCQGPLYPTCLAMLCRWNPPDERTSMYAISNSGATLGSIAGMALGGILCQSNFLGGWPSPFYLFGTLSIIWGIAWLLLVYDTPATHPRISIQEKMYIEKETDGLDVVKYTHLPWRSVLTSLPVVGVAVVLLADNFGFYVTFNSMPVYMKQVLGFDLSQDGLINAVPYAAQLPITYFVSWFSVFMWRKNVMRLVNLRRIFTILGECCPALCMVALGYSGCDKLVAIAMLATGVGFNALTLAGSSTSLFDIAPLYAGCLMGILNGFSNIGGFISPAVVGFIAGDSSDQNDWRLVFFLTCGIYIFGALVYSLTATDKEEIWAREKRSIKTTDSASDSPSHPPLSIQT